MKFLITLFLPVFAIALQAYADEIVVTPDVPVNCAQSTSQEVTVLQTSALTTAGNATDLTFVLNYGTCQNGSMNLKTIQSNYDFYLIDQEYSSDFQYADSLSNNTVTVQASFVPAVFFAQYNIRHFDLSFFPNGGAVSFNFSVVFTKDPTTGQIRLSVLPK